MSHLCHPETDAIWSIVSIGSWRLPPQSNPTASSVASPNLDIVGTSSSLGILGDQRPCCGECYKLSLLKSSPESHADCMEGNGLGTYERGQRRNSPLTSATNRGVPCTFFLREKGSGCGSAKKTYIG